MVKSTIASISPLDAANFLAKYFGAVRMPTPYPDPAMTYCNPHAFSCHYVEAVGLTPTAYERPFWLHFIKTTEEDIPDGTINFAETAARVAATLSSQKLASNLDDPLCQNAITFAIHGSLSPFINRLQSDNVDFVLRKDPDDDIETIFTLIPGSLLFLALSGGERH